MIALFDTSAMLPFLDSGDQDHDRAVDVWREVDDHGGGLVTHNYVVLEATALVQRRLGMEAVRDLHEKVLASVAIVWVTEHVHERALAALLDSPRGLSLVDLVSFAVMREHKIRNAFAFDGDFPAHGFTLVP
ncbi:MAG: type II toxin-antitoxin system VapC family toxin [Egibacteraceae bacterium]